MRNPGSALGFQVVIASRYWEETKTFFSKMPVDSKSAVKFLAEDVAGMAVHSTNLIFASEIFLKAFLLLGGINDKRKHGLYSLFTSLEDGTKKYLNENVGNVIASQGEATSGYIKLLKGEDKPYENFSTKAKKSTPPKTLEEAFSRMGEAYDSMRYLHELTDAGKGREIFVPYGHLIGLCRVSDTFFREKFPNPYSVCENKR